MPDQVQATDPKPQAGEGTPATAAQAAPTNATGDGTPGREDEIRALRAEAAKTRIQLRESEQARARLEAAQTKADRERAEQQGEFEKLWRDEQAEHAAFRSTVKSRLLSERVESLKLAHGIPAEDAPLIAVDLSGIEVADDLTIPETVAERVKAVADRLGSRLKVATAPAVPAAEPAKPAPLVIGERRNSDPPPAPKIGLDGTGARLTEKLMKRAGVAPA